MKASEIDGLGQNSFRIFDTTIYVMEVFFMFLYKAIKYEENNPKKMNSELQELLSWDDIILDAFSHISCGDRKQKKDYWISTTKSLKSAIERLETPENRYNGIAVFEIPNTKIGVIYDENLRNYDYLDKNHCSLNNDGIITTLDMSSEYTIGYVASFLWLKGYTKQLRNLRTYAYANKEKEILVCGRDIKFTFYHKSKINKIIPNDHELVDKYEELFLLFIECALEYKTSLGCRENTNDCQDKVMEFYKNLPFYLDKNNNLTKYATPSFYDYRDAYFYALIYINIKYKNNTSKIKTIFNILKLLYKKEITLGNMPDKEFERIAFNTPTLLVGKFAVRESPNILQNIDITNF